MARFLVTSGSQFDPFTYDELIKPVNQMQQAYDTANEAYDVLNLETENVGQYIGEGDEDRLARQMYTSYTKQLSDLQNELWANGITAKTKHGLSAARRGYAQVDRLKKAIETRQARSKEYWTARHNNPSLITGRDPGTYGLDKYLGDDNFGQDYYTYSGVDFANEVGADAKARADELLRDARVERDPELKGKILRIKQEGFTSLEVEHAGSAVEAVLSGDVDSSVLANLTPEEQILADVLITHVNSTGAKDKITPDEFRRLIQYGRKGLSQSIGKTSDQIIEDEVWKNNQAWNMWKRQYDYQLNNPKPTSGTSSGDTKYSGSSYTLNDISSYMEAKNAKKINKTLGDKFEDPFKEPIVVTERDGSSSVISSPYDAERILNSLGRKFVQDRYGIDPDNPIGKWTVPDWNGGMREVTVNSASGGYGGNDNGEYIVYTKGKDGKPVVDEEYTRVFNVDVKEYRANVKDWQEKNKGVDLKKLQVSPRDRKKIYEQYNLPAELPFEDVPYVLETLAKQGHITPATIAGATADMEDTRENYAGQIIASFNRIKDSKGKVSKTDEYAFYPVNGYDIEETGKTNLSDVFGSTNGNTKLPNKSTLEEITVLPEDLAKNKVRVSIKGETYAVNPAMLGNDIDYAINQLREPVLEMMTPIIDPAKAMMMSPAEAANWTYTTMMILGDYMSLASKNENGETEFIEPSDIVRNPALQGALRQAVTRLMNAVLADPRDNMMLNNYQVRGNTSTEASGYNDNLSE